MEMGSTFPLLWVWGMMQHLFHEIGFSGRARDGERITGGARRTGSAGSPNAGPSGAAVGKTAPVEKGSTCTGRGIPF
jgi:hypothetical protein